MKAIEALKAELNDLMAQADWNYEYTKRLEAKILNLKEAIAELEGMKQ